MANYYPAISRAISNLEYNSAASRQNVYERARAAQMSQLRKVVPALTQIDIDQERQALETAIDLVEEEHERARLETLFATGSPYDPAAIEESDRRDHRSTAERIVAVLSDPRTAVAATRTAVTATRAAVTAIFRSGRPPRQ